MEPIQVYKCLCDKTRLRILNLLTAGPLCVCHFQEILGESQVKISKHLRYLRDHQLVTATKMEQWMIYEVAEKNELLDENLRCLQDCAHEMAELKADLNKRKSVVECCGSPMPDSIRAKCSEEPQSCCEEPSNPCC